MSSASLLINRCSIMLSSCVFLATCNISPTSSSYVVCTSRRPQVNWSLSSDPSSSNAKPSARADELQQVFIGIFPASHIFVRDEVSDAEGRLTDLFNALNSSADGRTSEEVFASWKSRREMDPVREEDEADDTATRKSFKLNPPPDQAPSTRARLPVYPASIRSASPTESQFNKPLPPRPTLTSGDDTLSGAQQPIIDEIASALREWHALMFQYLAQRDYRLFHIVREYIEVLHLGRRQLLSQTLSSEETVNLRRECVARLVSGNLLQGLDVIVRHPTWGGLVNVDVEGEIDPRSWMSAVRMYALQASLAQMDVSPTPANTPYKLPHASGSIDYTAPVPTAIPLSASLHSAFPDLPRPRGHSRLIGSLSPSAPSQPKAKFYHVFLDLRAFVASPCAPGETAELYFNLYNKADARFVSEEFCAVLNHNGVLARDPSARIRTLFTDLVQSDAQDPIYLVCKIVRNGALKLGSNMGSISENPRQTIIGSSGYTNGSMSNDSFGRSSTSTDPPQHFRRPFGCAVLELTQLNAMAAEQTEVSSTREHTMPIYVPTNETTFSMLHQDILNHNVREYEKSPRYADHLHLCWTVVDNATGPRCLRCRSRFFMGTPRLS